MPTTFVPKLTKGRHLQQIRKLRFKLVVGDEDAFYENNLNLSKSFEAQRIKHELHLWCGEAHRFRYWRQMVRIYR
jgi:esterase/lipase superfamily enzyme